MTGRSVRAWGTTTLLVALLVALLAACSDSSPDDAATLVPVVTAPTETTPTTSASPTASTSPQPSASPSKRAAPSGTRPPAPATHTPGTNRHAALGKDFTLAVGESARIDGTDVVVRFARLVEDSRCPTGVTCIRAGEALIAVTVRGAGEPATFQLQVPAGEGNSDRPGNEKRVGRYVVHLESVDPYPSAPAAGTSDVDLSATLRVTRG